MANNKRPETIIGYNVAGRLVTPQQHAAMLARLENLRAGVQQLSAAVTREIRQRNERLRWW